MRKLALGGVLLLAALAASGLWIWRRALPATTGTVALRGLAAPVEIVRDRWGVPHIFAKSDEDASFALGYCHAQDRLFQMELSRRVGQGRLAELRGPALLDTDKLFRTVDLVSPGRRMLAAARPEARAAFAAYAKGVNAGVASLGGRLPPEFTALRSDFAPMKDDDFLGTLGYMTWGLNQAWTFDPLFEKLVAQVGSERARALFPFNRSARVAVHPEAARLQLSLFQRSPEQEEWLGFFPSLAASNNWVVAGRKSASGHPLLANDPHLGHGLPGIWYQAHLVTPALDVIGVGVPGLPFVAIGHNRDIAWGFTNVMLDGSDFFVETLRPETGEVMSRGEWVKLAVREEIIKVKGQADVRLRVKSTPHGPIVSDLLKGEKRALAFQWNYHGEGPNEVEGFYELVRARDFEGFRKAV
ncbi:MAG TPA: penicillin acylase family protein, partial [Vicinamibacteria bacterium]